MCILHTLPPCDRALPSRAPGPALARRPAGILSSGRALSRIRACCAPISGRVNRGPHQEETIDMTKMNPPRRALIAAMFFPALIAAASVSAKTLVFCSEGSPENFYPAINTTGTSFDANSQIYSRIVDFERGGTRVVPGLAERWDISPDGKTYTFHLRRGVKWHSNRIFKPTRDFDADDVVFSLERQWKENHPFFKVTSSNHSYFNDMNLPALLKSVEKLDAYTVRVTLNEPE